jgi:hypothetical protein
VEEALSNLLAEHPGANRLVIHRDGLGVSI